MCPDGQSWIDIGPMLTASHWSLQWRPNGRNGVSNHQPHDCFSTQPFIQARIKENIKAPRHFHLMTSSCTVPDWALPLWSRNKMAAIFQTFSNAFSWMKFAWISINISLNFVPNVRNNNIAALVQIMAWRRSGGKSQSKSLMFILPTHTCVTRPQWVRYATFTRRLPWHWFTGPSHLGTFLLKTHNISMG